MTIRNDLVNSGIWDAQAKVLGDAIVASNIASQLTTTQIAALSTATLATLTTTQLSGLTTAEVAVYNTAFTDLKTILGAVKALTKES